MRFLRLAATCWCLAVASLCSAQTATAPGSAAAGIEIKHPQASGQLPDEQTPAMPPAADVRVDFAREIKPIFAKWTGRGLM
jgi:hypothetical protein